MKRKGVRVGSRASAKYVQKLRATERFEAHGCSRNRTAEGKNMRGKWHTKTKYFSKNLKRKAKQNSSRCKGDKRCIAKDAETKHAAVPWQDIPGYIRNGVGGDPLVVTTGIHIIIDERLVGIFGADPQKKKARRLQEFKKTKILAKCPCLLRHRCTLSCSAAQV